MNDIAETVLPFAPTKRRGNPNIGHASKTPRLNGTNSLIHDALFNDKDPQRVFKHESPLQRHMSEMSMQGYTHTEIALATGRTIVTVSNALRQPAARQRMITKMQKDVSQEIRDFLRAEVMPSLQVLKDVREDRNAKPEVRMAAAEKLIERTLGKSVQVVRTDAASAKPVAEMSDAEIEARLHELQEQQQAAFSQETTEPLRPSTVALQPSTYE